MTQSQLAAMAVLTQAELHAVVKGQSIDALLRLRREVQVAIADRRKKLTLEESKRDPLLDGGLGAMMQLERWARQAAYVKVIPDLLRADPKLLTQNKQAMKIAFRQYWENYVKRMSY